MSDYTFTILIPLLPLFVFVLLGLFGKRYFRKSAGLVGSAVMLISAALSVLTAIRYFGIDGKLTGAYHLIKVFRFQWLQFSPGLSIDMGVQLDAISVMMLVIVSFVSLMVHVFSLGYMKGEERLPTYFSFLSLFTFSMLGLVISTNIFEIYFFWELVGVSSFLLIGFYYRRPSAVAAAKKAFIVTRFADFGFLIGILILGINAGSFDFSTLIARLTSAQSPELARASASGFMGMSVVTWGLSLVFIGGAGKSAMFPLHIWLPDAMEGPTPVSALIHAATMVVAGVYLVARLYPVYAVSAPQALHLVMYTGAFSAIFAAVIACTQNDIKRVLAFSTMSQIGYMMFALGVAGYGGENGLGFSASMFHLFTHAFFKSLLFLGAGAIIHAIHTNDIRDMGGLRKQMPLTHICFLVACLAIAGIPPFAGFFSKEEIMTAAYQSNLFVYVLALLTAALTAFYMFRLYFMVFWNKTCPIQPHSEGTWSMKVPMVVLAICTTFAGLVPFSHYVTSDGAPLESKTDLILAAAPVSLAVLGIIAASLLYKKENGRPAKIDAVLGAFYVAAKNKFYIDELYLFITKKIVFKGVGRPAAWFDRAIVDGFMNRLAWATALVSERVKGLQSGRIQSYALYFFGGVAGLAVLFIYLWK